MVKVLVRVGFAISRQKGSHIMLRREAPNAGAVVADHRYLSPGTLRQVLNQAGLTT